MSELKPCPFCGEGERISIVRFQQEPLALAIQCACCLSFGPHGTCKQDIEKAWNTRPIEDKLEEKVKELCTGLGNAIMVLNEIANYKKKTYLESDYDSLLLIQAKAEKFIKPHKLVWTDWTGG